MKRKDSRKGWNVSVIEGYQTARPCESQEESKSIQQNLKSQQHKTGISIKTKLCFFFFLLLSDCINSRQQTYSLTPNFSLDLTPSNRNLLNIALAWICNARYLTAEKSWLHNPSLGLRDDQQIGLKNTIQGHSQDCFSGLASFASAAAASTASAASAIASSLASTSVVAGQTQAP